MSYFIEFLDDVGAFINSTIIFAKSAEDLVDKINKLKRDFFAASYVIYPELTSRARRKNEKH